MSAPPPRALRDFPIWPGVVESYRRSLAHLPHFPVAATIPAVLTLIVTVASLRMAVTMQAEPESGSSFLALLLFLLGYVPYVLFAVAWFRLSLLGEAAARPTLVTGWQRRHWRFLRYVFAMIALTLLVGLLGGLVFSVLIFLVVGAGPADAEAGGTAFLVAALAGLVTGLVISIVILRFSFVFPAVSVDEDYTLALSWRHTKGQGWRLLCAMILIALPFFLASMVLSGLLGGPLGTVTVEDGVPAEGGTLAFGPATYILQGINVVLGYMLTAVAIELISLAFRSCTGWIPGDGGELVPTEFEDGS